MGGRRWLITANGLNDPSRAKRRREGCTAMTFNTGVLFHAVEWAEKKPPLLTAQ